MTTLTSKLLRDMVACDQRKRIWLRDTYGSKRTERMRHHYDELKGASLQRKRIVKMLLKAKTLTTTEDYWHAGVILSMGKSKQDFFLAEYCFQKAARLKGERPALFDSYLPKYFQKRGWSKSGIIKEYKLWAKGKDF